ncbi:MAG: hypothetical protein J6I40_08195 [Mailhella sp.]|nr:hypothetical protein [Mailhella sp.]
MTEQQLKQQEQEIAALAQELSRLNGLFDQQKQALGIAEGEEVTFDEKEMTPELQKAFDAVKAEAEKAGRARSSQAAAAAPASSAPHARRGAVRI